MSTGATDEGGWCVVAERSGGEGRKGRRADESGQGKLFLRMDKFRWRKDDAAAVTAA